MRILVLTQILAFAIVAALPEPSDAACHRQFSYSYTPYYAPAVYVQQQVYVPVAVAVPFYYSTVDQTTQNEAAAYKAVRLILDMQMQQGFQKQQQSNPYQQQHPKTQQAPQYDLPTANSPSGPNAGNGFVTAVNPAFAAEVQQNCLGCHNEGKKQGGLSLADLGSLPEEIRKKCVQRVMNGSMPKNGTPRPIGVQAMYKEWLVDAIVAFQ